MQDSTETYEQALDLRRAWEVVWRMRNVLGTVFIFVMLVASVVVFRMPNVYHALAQLLVEKVADTATAFQEVQTSEAMQLDYYATQVEIMQSDPLLSAVVEDLDLAAFYDVKEKWRALERLRQAVSVRQIKATRLFELKVRMTDPELAAKTANAIAERYIRQNIESKLFVSKEILKWFPEEAEKIKVQTPYGQLEELSREEVAQSLPSVVNNPLLQKLRGQQAELKAELAALYKRFKEKHPEMIRVKTSLQFIDESIRTETQNIINNLKAGLAAQLQISNIQVVKAAEPPRRSSEPKRALLLLLVAFLEVALSCGAVMLHDMLDDTVKDQEDVERFVKLPFLGFVPKIKLPQEEISDKTLFAALEPQSALAESVRNIRVSLNFSIPQERAKFIVVTSSIPAEGKSVIATNLAISLAQDGNRTLLVDCDLRRPRLHRVFSYENKRGVSNLLTSSLSATELVVKTRVERLDFLGSGPVSPNPAELFGSNRMDALLAELATQYDRVILDAPPVIGLADAAVLAGKAQNVMIVVMARKVSRDIVRESKESLMRSGGRVVGVVLNGLDFERERRHYRYYRYSYTTHKPAASKGLFGGIASKRMPKSASG